MYGLQVSVGSQDFDFNVLSSGSATATNINDLFRAQMAANAAFSALVTASGTATLILTGVTAGTDFSVYSNGPGVVAIASTTPAAVGTPSAMKLRGVRFMTDTTGPGIAMAEVSHVVNSGLLGVNGY